MDLLPITVSFSPAADAVQCGPPSSMNPLCWARERFVVADRGSGLMGVGRVEAWPQSYEHSPFLELWSLVVKRDHRPVADNP